MKKFLTIALLLAVAAEASALDRSPRKKKRDKKAKTETVVPAPVPEAEPVPVPEPEPAAATLTPGKTLVLITTETFGRGNDELGEKLMGNFLATLPELGESLWRVILLNGGVKLAATPGKSLENAGTDVLVCGTCLDFYGLLEAKQVGQTTNMLDVVTSLALADKVIRP